MSSITKSKSPTVTLHLNSELNNQLNDIALELNKTRVDIITDAIQQFIDVQTWQTKSTKAAIQQADEGGDFVSHEKVEAWLDTWGTKEEIAPPKVA